MSDDGVWSQVAYQESTGGHGKLMSKPSKNSKLVPCFPLYALLVALNQSIVDYLSLDVEGLELQVGATTVGLSKSVPLFQLPSFSLHPFPFFPILFSSHPLPFPFCFPLPASKRPP